MTRARLTGHGRRFLFLQGPHGPFVAHLARALAAAGAESWRVGFNAGDRLFWRDRSLFIAYDGALPDWEAALARILDRHGITDLVLYGETRPVHATAARVAAGRGLTRHFLEEGYMRPWWVTYERAGTNGRSPLMDLTIAEMRARLRGCAADATAPADRWGDLRRHMAWSALYHGAVLAGPRPGIPSHREPGLAREFVLHLHRFLALPRHRLERHLGTRRVLGLSAPFHLALLQLEHDPSFRDGSGLGSMTDFAEIVVAAFAEGAAPHHHLVFKAHPLEDGRVPLRAAIRRAARARGIGARVHFVRGGKLGPLMDRARSAVTANSTAAQQALWRGLPVRCLGRAVYAKPELVSDQPLAAFFADPRRPDPEAYAVFRNYLLETCQIPGGFYSRRGRRLLLPRLVDLMLDPADPYEAQISAAAASAQHLRDLHAPGLLNLAIFK